MSDVIYYSNEALQLLTEINLGQQNYGNLSAALYTSEVTPHASNTYDGTYEAILCSLSGGGPVDISPGDWTITTAADVATGSIAAFNWNFAAYDTSSVTIFGMILVMQIATVNYLYGEIPFGTPYEVPAGGANFSYQIAWGQTATPVED